MYVYAKWRDGHFYSGYIVNVIPELGQYEIVFDDGNRRTLSAGDLIQISMITIGQEVLVSDDEGVYVLSIVKQMLHDGEKFEVESVVDKVVKRLILLFRTKKVCRVYYCRVSNIFLKSLSIVIFSCVRSDMMLNANQAKLLGLGKDSSSLSGLITPKSADVSLGIEKVLLQTKISTICQRFI